MQTKHVCINININLVIWCKHCTRTHTYIYIYKCIDIYIYTNIYHIYFGHCHGFINNIYLFMCVFFHDVSFIHILMFAGCSDHTHHKLWLLHTSYSKIPPTIRISLLLPLTFYSPSSPPHLRPPMEAVLSTPPTLPA